MKTAKLVKNRYFWGVLSIVIATIVLALATYTRGFALHYSVGPLFIHHWFSWGGTLFIAGYTPAYFYLKRRYPARYHSLYNLHMFGNLISVLLISIHFAQQMGRPEEFFPDLGTGLALFIAMCTLVTTGILRRFQIVKKLTGYYQYLHIGATMTFYIIIVIHILHGVGVI